MYTSYAANFVDHFGVNWHERIALLQLRKRTVLPAMVGELIVGKAGAGNGPHADPYACAVRAPSMWSVASLAASSGVLPRSRATT